MMRRIELLPQTYVERQRQRRTFGSVLVFGVLIFVALVAFWFYLGMQISGERDKLAEVQTQNSRLESQIAELERFAQLEQEVQDKQIALETVMAGDVDWPAVMTELAMVVPGEVWLREFRGSAGMTEGATQVGTETAVVRINEETPFGRVSFTGRSLTMPGVAKWLIGLGKVKDFEATWLEDATEEEVEEQLVIGFTNTIEFNERVASERFQGGER